MSNQEDNYPEWLLSDEQKDERLRQYIRAELIRQGVIEPQADPSTSTMSLADLGKPPPSNTTH
jgi:hypothetical protein